MTLGRSNLRGASTIVPAARRGGARRRVVVLATVLALASSACGAAGSHSVARWPASGPVELEEVLRMTARHHGLDAPVLPDGTPAWPRTAVAAVGDDGDGEDHEEDEAALPFDDAGVHATSAVFEGLWYAEVVLGDVSPDAPLPLVVALHGRGDAPRLPGGPFRRAPTPMRLLLPRGPLLLGDGYAWARYSVAQNHPEELAEDLGAAADRVARLIEHVRSTRPTLGAPMVTGFSQGAILAWMTALAHPESVGLALLVAGWVPPAAMPTAPAERSARVRALHGAADPIVPAAGTRDVIRLLAELDYDVELVEFSDAGHVVTDAMNLRFEAWLEEALAERAPELSGGLGVAGPDDAPFEPTMPLLHDVGAEVAVPAPPL